MTIPPPVGQRLMTAGRWHERDAVSQEKERDMNRRLVREGIILLLLVAIAITLVWAVEGPQGSSGRKRLSAIRPQAIGICRDTGREAMAEDSGYPSEVPGPPSSREKTADNFRRRR
jgi:hypothetical protein